jgi:S-(hydroxymethyl)glutathione dehydrogenase/alcohol dehydrogenase
VPSCGHCLPCAAGRPALCEPAAATNGAGTLLSGARRLHRVGHDVHHHLGVSAFADHATVSRRSVVKIDRELPLDEAALFGCAVLTGVGAVVNTAKVTPGSNVVVFGLGGIGLNVIQGARMAGADKIVGIDTNPSKRAMAEKFGMTDFVNPKDVGADKVVQAIVDLTGGGADFSFECIGLTSTMRQALECCHRGWGESIIIGVAASGQEISTRPFQLVTGRVWKGTAFGGARGRTDVPKIVDWYMEGKINIDDLITHTMPLAKINDAFDMMHEGKSIRSVVVY